MELSDVIGDGWQDYYGTQLMEWIADRYHTIGKGYYSRVVRAGGYAVKLGGYEGGLHEFGDIGGLIYAKWCLNHQHLKAVPRILYFEELGDDMYISVMEILKPLNDRSNHIFHKHASVIAGWDNQGSTTPKYILDFMEEFEEIAGVAYIDMHDQNYMQHPRGHMVIIDPFSGIDDIDEALDMVEENTYESCS